MFLEGRATTSPARTPTSAPSSRPIASWKRRARRDSGGARGDFEHTRKHASIERVYAAMALRDPDVAALRIEFVAARVSQLDRPPPGVRAA